MKIACLMSGGVDSSVATKLMVDAGHDVTAFYLKIWLEDEATYLGSCPWEEDLSYVRRTCDMLGIELEIVSLQKAYHDRVISYTLSGVKKGHTPNPDVLCNSFVKFGAFLEWLEEQNLLFDRVVTGHYAKTKVYDRDRRLEESADSKLQQEEQRVSLLAGKDVIKDQTYFLSRLSQEQLKRAWFPLGEYSKEEVREMAKKWHLPSAERPDSQGLCFLGKVDYREYLKHHIGIQEGDVVNEMTGEALGRHEGHWLYTIGQRHGLDLSGGPWYVTRKDARTNMVYVSHRLKMPEKERSEFVVGDVQWLEPKYENSHSSLEVKIRHGAERYTCEREIQPGKKMRVRLTQARERGIAPGQFAVFYDGELCVGSGVIME